MDAAKGQQSSRLRDGGWLASQKRKSGGQASRNEDLGQLGKSPGPSDRYTSTGRGA